MQFNWSFIDEFVNNTKTPLHNFFRLFNFFIDTFINFPYGHIEPHAMNNYDQLKLYITASYIYIPFFFFEILLIDVK